MLKDKEKTKNVSLSKTVAEALKQLVNYSVYKKPQTIGDYKAKELIDFYIRERPKTALTKDALEFEFFSIGKTWNWWWSNTDKKYVNSVLSVLKVFAKTEDVEARGKILKEFIKILPFWRLYILNDHISFFKKYLQEEDFEK